MNITCIHFLHVHLTLHTFTNDFQCTVTNLKGDFLVKINKRLF